MIRPILCLLLCFGAASAAPQPAGTSQADATLGSRWAARVAEAQTPEQRIALAGQLLAAAERANRPDRAVAMCLQAYDLGAQQPGGYAIAADALDLAQRIDPGRRVECLDRLRLLYAAAYQRSPQKLRLGTGLADVLHELATARRDRAVGRFEFGRLDPADVEHQLETAAAEQAQAVETLRAVLLRAAEDTVKAGELGRPDIADALRAFSEEHRPELARQVGAQAALEAEQERFRQLAGMIDRFRADPSSPHAQSVAAVLIIEFDQPELVAPSVLEALPGSMSGPAKLAAAPVQSLDADEALMLCRWYRDLADLAQDESDRRAMLVRARAYAGRVAALGDDRADEFAAPLERQLSDLGVDRAGLTDQLVSLKSRLDARAQAAEAAPPAAPPSVPDAASAPDGGSPMLSDASEAGRPMVVCEKCGQRFFPGWGSKQTVCPRCRSGHGNIFDFGTE